MLAASHALKIGYGTRARTDHSTRRAGLAAALREEAERTARYVPQLRFRLLDPARRTFWAERMCYAGGIDDWLTLGDTGPIEELAAELVPTLGTDAFYELW